MKKQVLIGFEIGTGEKVFLTPDHLIVTGVTQYSGKCLTGDCEILSIDGRKIKVKDAFKSKEIIKTVSIDENFNLIEDKLIDIFENSVKKVYEIETEDGRKINLTDNHPLLTINGWKEVKELKQGNYIAVPRTLELVNSNFSIPNSAIKIIACMITEGGMTISKSSPSFTTSKPLIANDLNNALREHGLELNKISEIDYRIRQVERHKLPFKKEKKRKGKAGCPSYGYWRNFCKIYGLKTVRSREKEIPEIIFKCSKDKIRLFLNRLFAGDGCYTKGKGIISYASTSKKLLLQVQHLLLRFGIKSRFGKKPELFITRKDGEKFLQQIGIFQREIVIKKINHTGSWDTIPIKIPTLKKYKDHWLLSGKRKGYPSRPILERYGNYSKNQYFINLANSDIYWVKIRKKTIVSKEMTYDVTTENTGNLVVNDVFVHNTTCLESLIQRLGVKAVAFRTKLGEKSFIQGTIIPPFFKDKSDWQFIQSLLEATLGEKLKGWDRSKIIQLSKGTNSLLGFKKKVDERLNEKLNAFERDILTNLQAYLEIVLPKLQSINFSNELELVEGINIIDLERFSRDVEVQSLIIRSVTEEVFYKYKNTIVILPEAPKFLPQKRGNPCKIAVEQFIREGATDNKLLWIDSQDMASTDKIPLKQISTWVLGYQSEVNEVKHTISQIPLPSSKKPKPDDIMTLKLGEFYVCTRDFVKKVYVMPFWLDEDKAKKVAMGKIKISELDAPETLTPFKIAEKKPETVTEKPTIDFQETSKRFQKELNEIRTDFFNKLEDYQEQFSKVYTEIFNLKNQPKIEIDEETIIGKVLQKLPTPSPASVSPVPVDTESIIKEVLARMPKSVGTDVYEVAPLEKITKDFLEEAKNKILTDIQDLSDNDKKALKYIESRGVDISNSELVLKCFKLKQGGGSSTKISNIIKALNNIEVIVKSSGRWKPNLKERIKFFMGTHEATEQEIENVYSHILMEILK